MLSAYTGTSDGGMVAQVYVQKYPGETGGLVLISTGDEPSSRRRSRRGRLCAGYVRDDLPGLQAGEGRLLFRKMQRDLIRLMHEPRIAYVSGGHLTTVLQAEKFIETIRAFLPSLGSNADRREWQ